MKRSVFVKPLHLILLKNTMYLKSILFIFKRIHLKFLETHWTPHHMSSGDYKLQHWDTSPYDGQTLDHCQHQRQVRLWSSRIPHSLLLRMQSRTATLEYTSVVSYTTEYTLPIWSRNHTSWYLAWGSEILCSQKTYHVNIHSSFNHNCLNFQVTKMSFSR